MKHFLISCTILFIPTILSADSRIEELADRIISLAESDREDFTTQEEELLLLIHSARFDPYPMTSHRIYMDQILDLSDRTVIRSYYDYRGAVTRQERKTITPGILQNYAESLVEQYLDRQPGEGLPKIVRVRSFSKEAGGEQDGRGNE